MKNTKFLFNTYLLLIVLLIVTILEVWTIMAIVFERWVLSFPDIPFLIKFVIIFYAITAATFFISLRLRKIYRFLFSIFISFLTTFCFYIYLLMGVYV